MAERRMFTKKITESDSFLDMPTSAQALYLHLMMNADDDGFVNSPKSIQRVVGASNDDMTILLAKKFIISFDTGVIVIKHWKMHNYIQSDRYKPTDYIEEKSMLVLDEKKAYSFNVSNMDTKCIQDVSIGKDRLGEDRIGKDRLGKDSVVETKPKRSTFVPPTLDEVKDFIWEKGYSVNPEKWYYYYESNGWMVGRNKMKSWQACIAQWNAKDKTSDKPKSHEIDWSKV